MPPLLSRRPTAAEIIEQRLRAGDYQTAALFIVAGCAEVIDQTRREEPAAATDPERTLNAALARILAPAAD